MSKAHTFTRMPPAKTLAKLRTEDEGLKLAESNAVAFIESRGKAIGSLARRYHLDANELAQEGYEVLLTCLRDYEPVVKRQNGDIVSVQFITFFAHRLEMQAMEMRNTNPEYKARAAHLEEMSDEEKAAFRADPSLLVQHLDQDSTMQEMLRAEVSETQDDAEVLLENKHLREGYFDTTLNQLIGKERDDKKRAMMQAIKVGGISSFQEIAVQFGVTDSRASQIMNELIDAFFVERLIQGDFEKVARDASQFKLHPKRVYEIAAAAMPFLSGQRAERLKTALLPLCEDVATLEAPERVNQATIDAVKETNIRVIPWEDMRHVDEKKAFPLAEKKLVKLADLKPLHMAFRAPQRTTLPAYINATLAEAGVHYPLIITEEGVIVDGLRRWRVAQQKGITELYAQVLQTPKRKKELQGNLLRVGWNVRVHQPDKVEVYYAICALADVGANHVQMAQFTGISRTNVAIYVQVRETASNQLRDLFLDGLIFITNAAEVAKLPEKAQAEAVRIIRTFGSTHGRGEDFRNLLGALQKKRLASHEKRLIKEQGNVHMFTTNALQTIDLPPLQPGQTVPEQWRQALQKMQQQLTDAQTWQAQREQVIQSQSRELQGAQEALQTMQKQLQATELSKHGNPEAAKALVKELQTFTQLTDRLAASVHSVKQATKQVQSQVTNKALTATQHKELQELSDKLESATNALRVSLRRG